MAQQPSILVGKYFFNSHKFAYFRIGLKGIRISRLKGKKARSERILEEKVDE